MDAPEAPSSEPAAPTLKDAAGALGARAVGLLGTRIELAGVELSAGRERLVASLLLVGAVFACGLLAMMVATFGVIAWFWDTARFAAIVVVTLAYAVAAVVLWNRFSAARRGAPPLLGATAEALRRDAAWLRGMPADDAAPMPDDRRDGALS